MQSKYSRQKVLSQYFEFHFLNIPTLSLSTVCLRHTSKHCLFSHKAIKMFWNRYSWRTNNDERYEASLYLKLLFFTLYKIDSKNSRSKDVTSAKGETDYNEELQTQYRPNASASETLAYLSRCDYAWHGNCSISIESPTRSTLTRPICYYITSYYAAETSLTASCLTVLPGSDNVSFLVNAIRVGNKRPQYPNRPRRR